MLEMALVQAAVHAPDDPLPRLAYADWLEDQGDERAELLRLQASGEVTERFRELSKRLDREWVRLMNVGRIRVGDRVEIVAGVFERFEGDVERTDLVRDEVEVYLRIFGRFTPPMVSFADLIRLPADR